MTGMLKRYAFLKPKARVLPDEEAAVKSPEPMGNLVGQFLQGHRRDFERSSEVLDVWEQLAAG